MSWLDGSSKRQSTRPKNIPGLKAKGSRLSTKRTYGSNREVFRGQIGSGGSYGSRRGELSSTNEEDTESPPLTAPSSRRLSPGIDSSPKQLAFSTDRCCDLDLGSPVDDSPVASPTGTVKKGKARSGKSKTTAARVRKDITRSIMSTGGNKIASTKSSSADPIDVDETSPKRKPSAGVRKSRAGRVGGTCALKSFDKADECEVAVNSAVERTQRSPVSRRDRSPAKRAAGRPTTRKPSPSLQSPLRPITNYTSDGERSQRGGSKVGDGRAALTFEGSSGDSTHGSGDGSSGEDEWQDEGMDFTAKRGSDVKVESKTQDMSRSDAEGDGRQPATGRSNNGPVQGARAAASIGDKMGKTAAREAGEFSSDSDSECEWTEEERNEEDDLNEKRSDQEPERVPTPLPPPSSPGVSVSLDSSIEGILVGDKRRRGGKRGARAAEDNAHRSSRSRLLSPNMPVSAGFGDYEKPGGGLGESIVNVDENNRRASICGPFSGPESSLFATMEESPGTSARHRRSLSAAGHITTKAYVPSLATTPAGEKVDDGDDLALLGDESSPPRLIRSMSSSQALIAPAFGGASSGCAKVTGSSSRRRSRASSTSSPLPVLETSKSSPAGGFSGTCSAAAAGNWSFQSMGSSSGAFRSEIQKRRSSTSEVLAPAGAPLVRSHRMSIGGAQVEERSSPSCHQRGLSLGEVGSGELSRASGMDDDPDVKWVLRAPSAPAGYHRSQSFVGGEMGCGLPRFSSAPTLHQKSGMGRSASMSRFSGAGWEMPPLEGGAGDSPAGQTPQTSLSPGTNAATRRARGLSSVARRMNRLEIRSPDADVETHAAEAQQAILSSPMVADGGRASPTRGMSTPIRCRISPSSFQVELTPVGSRSRPSGVGGSPTECLRDYLSGQQGCGQEEDRSSMLSGHEENQQREGALAPATPSEANKSMAVTTASPPGITCTRSAALGLPSPLTAGIFSGGPDSRRGDGGRKERVRSAGDAESCEGDSGGGDEANGDGETGAGDLRRGFSRPRKGGKLAREGRARTVPLTVGEGAAGRRGSLEGGFLIRRKSVGHSALPSSGWPSAFAGDDAESETPSVPSLAPRVSSGSGSSSQYLSCLSSGADVESPVQDGESVGASRHSGISSPMPLPYPDFETPSALVASGKTKASGSGQISGDGDVGSGTTGAQMADSVVSESKRDHSSPTVGMPSATASGVPDWSSRRTSAESVGASISHAQFETPQPETKCKWGSRPQYGDWGISQPASAGTLKRLADRLMAFAGKAIGEETDLELQTAKMASPGINAMGTPLRSATPLEDDGELQSFSRGTPGSTESTRGAGGGAAYRHSLGTLSEHCGESGVKNEEELMGLEGGSPDITGGTGRNDGVGDFGEVWGDVAASAGESGKPRDGSFGERPGRSRLSSLLMTEAQREEQRRRQSKAKRRRVSLSMKKFRHGSMGVSSRLAGLSLLDAADADSPGGGKAIERLPRYYPTPFDGSGRFGGGAIAEGEEEEDEEEQNEEPTVLPRPPAVKAGEFFYAEPDLTPKVKGPGLEEAGMSYVTHEEGDRGETPAKVREDLEKSLTDLNNLSLSMCHSDEDENVFHEKPGADFVLELDSVSEVVKNGHTSTALGRNAGTGTASSCSEKTLEALRRQGVMAKVMCMLSVDDLMWEVPLVCAAWRKAAILAYAEVASDMGRQHTGAVGGGDGLGRPVRGKALGEAVDASRSVWSLQKLVDVFPWGSFLSEGACKQVYRVWNAAQRRMEALSVMDREQIAGDEEVVSQEIRVSILASSLVQRGVCPNFVQTFGLFRSECPPPPELLGTAQEKYPCGRSPGMIRSQPLASIRSRGVEPRGRHCATAAHLRYQFIGMELCEHGDAEMFIKTQRDGLLALREAQGFLFQMAFALYAGRAELSLRHFDVKLLNFFVGDLRNAAAEKGGVRIRYGLGQDVMELHLPRDRAYVVKLADFGTADVNPMTIGAPVEEGHYTTLENTPIEQLCCGSAAQQGYASDTFALALAGIHLFTGEAPYEEIMEEVECPDDLYDALVTTWNDHPQYADLCEIVLDGDGGDDNHSNAEEEDEDDQDSTLMDTFYRYLVLFGVPERAMLDEAFGRDNPVWKAVGALLGWKAHKSRGSAGSRGRRAPGSSAASKRFCRQLERDQAAFSLARGTNLYIKRARARLDAIPGAREVVMSMASFAPALRPTMLEVMRSEVFSSLRGTGTEKRGDVGKCLEFMAFARGGGDKPPLNL